MKCPFCNNENSGTFQFCGFCGRRLPEIQPVKDFSSDPLDETVDETAGVSESDLISTKAETKGRRRASGLLYVFLVISILCGGTLGLLKARGLINLDFLKPENGFEWSENTGIQSRVVGSKDLLEDETLAPVKANTDYVFPDSNTSYISESELGGLSQQDVRASINEIYARHGLQFEDEFWKSYFESKSWYKPSVAPEDFSNSVFNYHELKNIEILVNWESDRGWR